jgi:outer membrane receptor protein involved in Fe transport
MRANYKISCAVAAILTGCGGGANADSGATPAGVETVVVTAERRDESLQSVPSTVQAFTGKTLADLNVTTLDDILKYTPNVSYGNNGPGQGNIFMRGLSAGFAGNQSSATVGNFPNVAVYLDDQSMQFPARNVDIYMADMNRIEVLEGPQGTLFGGGAEAGAVRYITNKPELDTTSGKVEASYGTTEGGDQNTSVNATLNVPLIKDTLAVRVVVYNDRQGGYIDNVPSTFTRSNQDLGNSYFNITPNLAGICPNGQPAGAAGLCAIATAPQANNFAIARKDQNPVTYTGLRVSALYQINEDWDVLIAQSFQDLDAEGLSVEYPTGSDFQPLAPLQVTSFSPSYDKDKFENTSWTVDGMIGDLKLVYTGGYMDRHLNQQMEYTNYSRSAGGMYYQCVGGSTGWSSPQPACYSPIGYWQDTVRNTHLSSEFRVSTPDDWSIRAIAGVYYEDFKIYDIMNFNYKTIPACTPANLAIALGGGPICIGDVAPAANATTNDPSIRSDSTAFGEDTQRGYTQTAFFGSVNYDVIPEILTVTGGTRWYQYKEFEVGSQYQTDTACQNVLAPCNDALHNINNDHDKKTYAGFKSSANVTWHVTPDFMLYYTFSQGFRPGGFNRKSGLVAPLTSKALGNNFQFNKPLNYKPDSLVNNEVGAKSNFFDHRLQLDVSAYYMRWTNVQLLFFNPTELGNTTFGVNGPSYDVKGVEAQVIALVTDGLTLQGSASYNDATQANSPCLVNNVVGSPGFGTCITQVFQKGVNAVVPFQNPFGAPGTVPAFSPKFQGNLRARYDWSMDGYNAFAMTGVNYTGSMFNQPATYLSGDGVTIPNTTYLRYLQPSYTTYDASFGVSMNNWSAEIYGTNLGNSHASTFTSSAQFIKSEVPIRPRVLGLKLGFNF